MPLHTFAVCDYSTQVKLNTEASNVKIDYEIKSIYIDENDEEIINPTEEQIEKSYGVDAEVFVIDVLNINIFNITNDIYLKLTSDDLLFSERIISYQDTNNGSYSIRLDDLSKIRNFEYTIYTNNIACSNAELRKGKLTTPKYNEKSELTSCEGRDDLYYCQKYITSEINLTTNEVNTKILEITKDNSENKQENDVNFWIKNKNIIIIGVILLVIAGGTATIIFVINKRSRVK